MQFSHSRVELWNRCPFAWKLHYLDKLEILPEYRADDPLLLGSALHRSIEKGLETGLREYRESFPVLTDGIITEEEKLSVLVPKVMEAIPEGKHEVLVEDDFFRGFIDLLVETRAGSYDIWDFKYSNSIEHYMKSPQLSIYKFFAEWILGIKVTNLWFCFVPKISVKQEKDESIAQYRHRLSTVLQSARISVRSVPYDIQQVKRFVGTAREIEKATEYPKRQSSLCRYCDYYEYCHGGKTYMILPKNERRKIETSTTKKVLWIYGQPFVGKTYLANTFPDPLMINTDGNIRFVDAPYVSVHDMKTFEGHIEKTKLGWDVFKEVIKELEKHDNTFKTIVIDLVEDIYEYCRYYIYDRLGISHESDKPFVAWDEVRTEFLSTMKRVMTLDYENIVLISHEDSTKNLTKRNGDQITKIMPNINEKVAYKLAGMIDLVGRLSYDKGARTLSFARDDVVFGGGRIGLSATQIPAEYKAICKIYADGFGKTEEPANAEKTENAPEKPAVPSSEESAGAEEAVASETSATPRRRRRHHADAGTGTAPAQEPQEDKEDIPF